MCVKTQYRAIRWKQFKMLTRPCVSKKVKSQEVLTAAGET